MTTARERIVHQPLHPSIIPRLDPEYLEFHNAHLQYIVPPETLPWSSSIRNGPAVPGASEPLKVGKTEDFDLPKTKFRAFTPEGDAPEGGWPVLIYFHGGGWTLGDISSETSFATNVVVRAKCVVASVDYRLAPENPYPAAVEDAVDALDWVIQYGKSKLNVNTSRIAVGGSSSGGNLAAILALKASQRTPQIPLMFQLLIVPVTDNTLSATLEEPRPESASSASESNTWIKNQHTPWLTPRRMTWFLDNYLPNAQDRTNWDASPIFAPPDLVRKLTPKKAWIAIAELDILAGEGLAYGKMLQDVGGVDVEIKVYEKAPHPVMAMDGALKVGRQLVLDAAQALANAFGTA